MVFFVQIARFRLGRGRCCTAFAAAGAGFTFNGCCSFFRWGLSIDGCCGFDSLTFFRFFTFRYFCRPIAVFVSCRFYFGSIRKFNDNFGVRFGGTANGLVSGLRCRDRRFCCLFCRGSCCCLCCCFFGRGLSVDGSYCFDNFAFFGFASRRNIGCPLAVFVGCGIYFCSVR